jgi:hypothetical protein
MHSFGKPRKTEVAVPESVAPRRRFTHKFAVRLPPGKTRTLPRAGRHASRRLRLSERASPFAFEATATQVSSASP